LFELVKVSSFRRLISRAQPELSLGAGALGDVLEAGGLLEGEAGAGFFLSAPRAFRAAARPAQNVFEPQRNFRENARSSCTPVMSECEDLATGALLWKRHGTRPTISAGAVDFLARALDLRALNRARRAPKSLRREGRIFPSGWPETLKAGAQGSFRIARRPLPWSEEERLTSGITRCSVFYVSGHPLEKYASRLKDLGALSLDELEAAQRQGITVAALIVGHSSHALQEGAVGPSHDQDMTRSAGTPRVSESFRALETF